MNCVTLGTTIPNPEVLTTAFICCHIAFLSFNMTEKIKSPLEEALATLTDALALREKELDDREEKLKQYEKRLEADYSLAYGETTSSDVLHLNVGGTKTTVLRRTLTAIPGSMLATRFSGRWDDSLEKDKDGDFFIDQDFSLFNLMLTYLRNRSNGDDKYGLKSPELKDKTERFNFYRMVEYYGMTDGIYPTKLIAAHPNDSLEMVGPKKLSTNKWATFALALDGHSRKIKTFEVTLGEVQRFQIGWGYFSHFENDKEEDRGVGEVNASFGLDLTRSTLTYTRSGFSTGRESVDGLEHPAGTVVVSKDYGRLWFLNGELVYDASGTTDLINEKYEPHISIKGDIEITSIELDN